MAVAELLPCLGVLEAGLLGSRGGSEMLTITALAELEDLGCGSTTLGVSFGLSRSVIADVTWKTVVFTGIVSVVTYVANEEPEHLDRDGGQTVLVMILVSQMVEVLH